MLSAFISIFLIAVTLERYYFLTPFTSCGSTFYTKSGIFSPPSFYKPNITTLQICKWRISVYPDEKIVLNITSLDTEKTPNCSSSHVEVRDGYWEDSPSLGRYCGEGVLDSITSTKHKMLITYVHKVGYKGFLAKYEAICGGEIYVRNEFLLHSNDHQENYSLNKKCVWTVVVPEQHQVVLKFKKFELEYQSHCLFDYVEIYDEGIYRGRFCGDTPPIDDIISTSNTLMIKFVSDASVQKKGFSIHIMAEFDECTTTQHDCTQICVNTIGSYRCACREGYELHSDGRKCEFACGGVLKTLNGVVQSPSFPSVYPPNRSCSWEIVAPAEHVVLLNFTHFDIEENMTNSSKGKCEKDKLQIFSGSGSLGTYCGNVKPETIVTENTNVKIVFSSDANIERTGFALNYTMVRTHCDKFNGNCHHRCINLISSRKCLCPELYTSIHDFDCKKECHYQIASASGTISSLNYPNYYENKNNCTWIFKTTPGHKIRLNFSRVETEHCHDYIKIYDGLSSSAPFLKTICGTHLDDVITSTQNELYVNFISDSSNTYQGFQARYSSVCGGTYIADATEKYIYSHDNYGLSDYYNNADCVWTIMGSSRYDVSLSVEVLDIEPSQTCEYDYLEIVGDYGDSTFRGKFCGDTKPQEEFMSNKITVKFHSDNSVSRRGFRLRYNGVLKY